MSGDGSRQEIYKNTTTRREFLVALGGFLTITPWIEGLGLIALRNWLFPKQTAPSLSTTGSKDTPPSIIDPNKITYDKANTEVAKCIASHKNILKNTAIVSATVNGPTMEAGVVNEKMPLMSLRIMLATILLYNDPKTDSFWRQAKLMPLLQNTNEPGWGDVSNKLGGEEAMSKKLRDIDHSFDVEYIKGKGLVASAKSLASFTARQLNRLSQEHQAEIFTAINTRRANGQNNSGNRLDSFLEYAQPEREGTALTHLVGNGNYDKRQPYEYHDLVLMREADKQTQIFVMFNQAVPGQTFDNIYKTVNSLEDLALEMYLKAEQIGVRTLAPRPTTKPSNPVKR